MIDRAAGVGCAHARPRSGRSSFRSGAVALCGALVSVSLLALDAQGPPTFRARVELITADVTVVDGDGRPVKDLGPADFTVRVGGDPRTIVSVQFVDASQTGVSTPEPAPLYSTNEGTGSGRLIALVVDEGNIRAGGARSALRSAARLLDRLTPADRVALFSLPGSGQAVPFTNDFARVRTALERLPGRASPIVGNRFSLSLGEAIEIAGGDRQALQAAMARECGGSPGCEDDVLSDAMTMADEAHARGAESVRGLSAVFEELAAMDGPKTMVLVSEGLLVDRGFGLLSDLGAAAAAARVSLYALRLGTDTFDSGRPGASMLRDGQVMAQGLETLVGLARGALFTVTSTGTSIFERLARELGGYYLVAFEPAPGDRDGKPHQIRIDVRGQGLTVRSRREFRAPDRASAPVSPEETVARAIRAPMLMTDLPLRVSTYAFEDGSGAKVRLAISAEVGRDRLAADEVAVGFALLDGRGHIVESGMHRRTIGPSRAGEPGPLVYVGAVTTPPGDYTLRLAVVDGQGQVGSIDRPVRARVMPAGPLRLGDLIVAERGVGALVPPAIPRIGREGLTAFLEIYGESESDLDAAQISIELAESPEAPPLVSSPAQFTDQREPRRRTALASVSAALVPPGRYIARASATVSGRAVGSVTRAFELVGLPAMPVATDPGAPAAGSDARPSPTFDVSAMVDPFERGIMLEAETVRSFVDELVANLREPLPSRLEAAVEEARQGHIASAASKAEEPRLHPVVTFLRGLAAFERGQFDTAANLFRSTLHASPGSWAAMAYLAGCYAGGGRDDEATGAWKTSLAGFEETPLVYALLIDAAMRMGDTRAAREALNEAGALWPGDDGFTRRHAWLLLAIGRPVEAYGILDGYLARHPDDEPVLLRAVQGIYQLAIAGGQVESAAQDLARARRYSAAYERVNGAQLALVKTWIAYLEKRTRN